MKYFPCIILLLVAVSAIEAYWGSCGNKVYLASRYDCCRGRVVSSTTKCSGIASCYGKRINLADSKCCMFTRRVIPRNYHCPPGHFCSGRSYNFQLYDCCRGQIKRRPYKCSGIAKCGQSMIDLATNRCCLGKSFDRKTSCMPVRRCRGKWYNYNYERCCGAFIIPRKEQCS